jgi:hypothetical protein
MWSKKNKRDKDFTWRGKVRGFWPSACGLPTFVKMICSQDTTPHPFSHKECLESTQNDFQRKTASKF